ncbi:hypothetical protein GGF32_005910 [Allomyces javanicus]|nr:hypothetical protein GGF32_005910 [Allomyces javanicus]
MKNTWYIARLAQMIFSTTVTVLVSIQRLKGTYSIICVFADAGLADWITDRRLRICLGIELVIHVVLITLLVVIPARHVQGAPVDCDADFGWRLRVRTAVLDGASSTDATKRILRTNRRFRTLFLHIAAAQAGMALSVPVGISVTYTRPGYTGDAIGALVERMYIAFTMAQWQYVTDLLKERKAKHQGVKLPASGSGSCSSQGTNGSGVLSGEKEDCRAEDEERFEL